MSVYHEGMDAGALAVIKKEIDNMVLDTDVSFREIRDRMIAVRDYAQVKAEAIRKEGRIQFMHIMTKEHGGLTLALQRSELEYDLVLYEVGAAFASPLERQFDRKKGRIIAEGRLVAQRHGYARFTRHEKDKKDSITKPEILKILGNLTRTLPRRRKEHSPGPEWFGDFLEHVTKGEI